MTTTTTTTTTLRARRSAPRATLLVTHPELVRDALKLGALAAIVAVVGAFWPAAALAALVWIAGGAAEVRVSAFALGVPMLAVTMPTTAIWWVGAVGTRRAVRSFRAERQALEQDRGAVVS